MSDLRILSLLPAATEIVFALGLEKKLVGVSHGCDYPKEALKLPKVTSSKITNILSSKEIDTQVKQSKHSGHGVFHIDERILKELKPNLILTQELCKVCAVSWTEVKKAVRILELRDKGKVLGVNIISLEPESVGDILENILLVGEVCGVEGKAQEVVEGLKKRLKFYDLRLKNYVDSPRVLMIEWLEPLMVAGHWVPEMVERAGGINVKTKVGDKSYTISLEEIIITEPSIVIFAPCGFDISRTLREKRLIDDFIERLKNKKIKYFLMDGDAFLTRPGPRIIDGIEILAEILHPELFKKKYESKDWREF